MTNAYAKSDQAGWEKLVERHLNEIDRSDPDMCYRYALSLSKKGASRASEVIKWSDVSLENKTQWTGDTYTSKVYSLLKLKSAAAQALWESADKKHATAPTPASEAEVEKWRNLTKNYAREWYEYAKTAGKDSKVPLTLCISAAGTADFCERG
jgi:hypothetical protein